MEMRIGRYFLNEAGNPKWFFLRPQKQCLPDWVLPRKYFWAVDWVITTVLGSTRAVLAFPFRKGMVKTWKKLESTYANRSSLKVVLPELIKAECSIRKRVASLISG